MAYASRPTFPALTMFAALLLACGPGTGDESGAASASTGPADTTAAEPTTGEPTPTTTAGESGSGTAEATTDIEPPTSETGDSSTTGTTTTGATEDTGDTDDTGTTTGAPDGLVLDPSTLEFFDLPIGSLRYAVGGFDPAQQTCVSIIFLDPGEQQHCDDFTVGDTHGFPYVFITPNAAPPCKEWDYAGNVQLDAATGCMQLVEPFPPVITIDMQLTVSGAPFTGTISVASE